MRINIRRIFAYLIDATTIAVLVAWLSYKFKFGSIYVMVFLIFFLCTKDLICKNASIGKRMMGISIVDYNGNKPSAGKILLRNIPSIILLTYDFFRMLTGKDKLGDELAQTTLVLDSRNDFRHTDAAQSPRLKINYKRLFAFLIDWILLGLLFDFYMYTFAEKCTLESERLFYTVLGFVAWGLCLCIRDLLFCNASFGKKIMGLCVVDEYGKKASALKVLLRNVTFLFVPFIGIEIVVFAISHNHIRIGDSLAKTRVERKIDFENHH